MFSFRFRFFGFRSAGEGSPEIANVLGPSSGCIGAGSGVPGGAQAPPELFLAPPEPFEPPLTIKKIMH